MNEHSSDIELLTTLTGARDLKKVEKLLYYDNNTSKLKSLMNITMEEVVQYTALTKTQAKRITAATELARRIATEPSSKRFKVCSPEDIASLFMEELRYMKQETFCILMLNVKNEMISTEQVSIGNIRSSIADPRDVFASAIRKNAASIALVHNHPSGDPEPSEADIKATKKLSDAGEVLDIKVIDHIIIGDGIYTSFKRKKLL